MVTYRATHDGGTTEVVVDQRIGGGAWEPLCSQNRAVSPVGDKLTVDFSKTLIDAYRVAGA